MDFSVNVQRLIYMALDTVNGNFNYHFMVRLLEAIVLHLDLYKFEVNFSGNDASRARNVYTGKPDGFEVPLNSKFLMKKLDGNNDLVENVNKFEDGNLNKDKNIILQTERDKIEDSGALNLIFLKQIEKMNYENLILNDKIGIPPIPEINAKQYANEIFMENIKTLTSRIDELESRKRKIPPVPLMKDISTYIECNSDSDSIQCCSSSSKSTIIEQNSSEYNEIRRKKVRIQSSPKEIIEPRCYHLKEKTQVPAAVLQKVPSIFNDVPEEESIPVSFQIPHAGGEKYILMHNEPEVLMKHIEKLLSRVNKIELIAQILLSNAGEPKQKSALSEYLSDSDDSDADNDYIKNSDNYANQSYTEKLLQLSRGKVSKFQREYGLIQKKKMLKETLSIGKFRIFYGDYTEKFEIINDLLSFQYEELLRNKRDINDLLKNKVSTKEYQSFKEAVMSTHISMKDDIADYILRDPEAAGIVKMIKGVTCVSCCKPTTMTTVNKSLKHPTKNVYVPKPPSKAHLSYELDRIRSKYKQAPKSKVTNILEEICNSIVPDRKKENPGQTHNILLNDRKIKSKIVNKTVQHCDIDLKYIFSHF